MLEPVTKEIVGGLLPTPRATSAMTENLKTVKQRGRNIGNLEEVIAFLPTPCSRDHKDSGEKVNYKKAAKKGKLAGVMVESRSNKTGKDTYLNPQFVEEMMGYPVGWTELKD